MFRTGSALRARLLLGFALAIGIRAASAVAEAQEECAWAVAQGAECVPSVQPSGSSAGQAEAVAPLSPPTAVSAEPSQQQAVLPTVAPAAGSAPAYSAVGLWPELIPTASRRHCSEEVRKAWRLRPNANGINGVVSRLFPSRDVFVDSGDGTACLLPDVAKARSMPPPAAARPRSRALTLVAKPEVKRWCRICASLYGRSGAFYRHIRPEAFPVGGTLLAARPRSPTRNVGVVMPERPCNHNQPCPVLVLLGSSAEKGSSIDSFHKVHGRHLFANYAQCDKTCSSSLGSILVIPEPLQDEAWDVDGRYLLKDLVTAFLADLARRLAGGLDEELVAVAGYGEGMRGVLHAVVRHPDVFSVALMLGPVDAHRVRDYLGSPVAPQRAPRLRLCVLAAGEMELLYRMIDRDVAQVLQSLIPVLDATGASLHLRVYANLGRNAMLDAPVNAWDDAMQVLWRGAWPVAASAEASPANNPPPPRIDRGGAWATTAVGARTSSPGERPPKLGVRPAPGAMATLSELAEDAQPARTASDGVVVAVNCSRNAALCSEPLNCHLDPPGPKELASWRRRLATPEGRANLRSWCFAEEGMAKVVEQCLVQRDLVKSAWAAFDTQAEAGLSEVDGSYCFMEGLCNDTAVTPRTTLEEAEGLCDSRYPDWREVGLDDLVLENWTRSGESGKFPGLTPQASRVFGKLACATGVYHCDTVCCQETYCHVEHYRRLYGHFAWA